MSEILQANIFFFISSAATIVFCLMICIVLYQLIKIMKAIRRIVDRIEAGSELIAEDMAAVREYVQSGGIFSKALGFIMKSRFGGFRRRDEE